MEPSTLRWLALALVAAGGFGLVYDALAGQRGPLGSLVGRYLAWLEHEARFLRLEMSGARIAALQGLGLLTIVLLTIALEDVLLAALVPIVAVVPYFVLTRRHAQRVMRIEAQLDGWLLVLANGLRSSPSLGESIRASVPLVEAPLSEELDVVLKEMRLGTPVDRAVLNLGVRVRTRTVQGALAALLVGRHTGGELSAILEETAASIREMTRLEGVLRAKTAEGRSQAYVLGAIPFFLIVAIHYIDPHWLEPLTTTTAGIVVTAISTSLWLAAIVIARRILAVDL